MHSAAREEAVGAAPLDVGRQETEAARVAQPEDGRPRDGHAEDLEDGVAQHEIVRRGHRGAGEPHAEGRAEAGAEGQRAGARQLGADGDAAERERVAREVERRLVDVDMAGDLEGLRARVEVHLVGAEGDGDGRRGPGRLLGARHAGEREERDQCAGGGAGGGGAAGPGGGGGGGEGRSTEGR